jgi:hypothetical protein
MKNRLPKIYFTIIAILLIWLGFAIRLHNLGVDSMWTDEIQTMKDSNDGLLEALDAPRDHPPLTYVLTALSIGVWEENEFAGRLPAFFAGVLTIPFILILGRSLGHSWIGIWAALFLVFSPFHLKYSQEVRHYSLLLLTSLSSYTFLYRAMLKPRRSTWAAYAVPTTLMLYTHYGGFVVLAAQAAIIFGWLAGQIRSRNFSVLSRIIPAVLLIPILYLPWLPRFLAAFTYNTSEDRLTGTGTATPIINWGQEAFTSFGMYYSWRPWLFLILAGAGFLFWIRRYRWQPIAFITVSLILPFILIQLFDVSRGAFARYIIYLLPFYLLLAAMTPLSLLEWLSKRPSSKIYLTAALGLALAFGISSLEPLRIEYQFVQSDWRGIIQYLDENANEGDIILGLALSHSNGFNSVHHALPYYLELTGRSYVLLENDAFRVDRLDALSIEEKNVFVVISNWDSPTRFDDPSLKVTPFSNNLFVIENIDQQEPLLDKISHYYQQILTITRRQIANCLLYKNLIPLETARGRYVAADNWLTLLTDSCSNLPVQDSLRVRGDTKNAIFNGLLGQMEQADQTGNVEVARLLANKLLTYNPKHSEALNILTAVNLSDMFNQGQAEIDLHQAPEPVSIQQFVMTHNGDAGEALLVHPPATAAFELTLPEEPVIFSSRLALAPASWVWGGDGVTFVLRLETAEGQTAELLRQHIGNTPADQTWHEVSVSLADYAGQQVTLILTTEEGPAGDGTGDWAGWETPRLLYLVD